MYGRNLPDKFFMSCEEDFPQAVSATKSDVSDVDLLLVVGTYFTNSFTCQQPRLHGKLARIEQCF